MVTTNKYYGTDDTAKYGNNITFATSNGNGNGDDTDSDADSEKENNELPDTGSDEQKWSDFRIIICCNWNITIR